MGCIQSARPQIMFQSIATRAEVSLPELETERLVLRAYQSSDLDVLAQIWADPAVTRFIGNQPRPRAQGVSYEQQEMREEQGAGGQDEWS